MPQRSNLFKSHWSNQWLTLCAVKAVLAAQGKTSRRQRELPAHVAVYYVICMALFMQVSYREVLRCLLEGLAWLLGPGEAVKITGKSGISQARTRLGWGVMRQLHEEIAKPIAVEATRGPLAVPRAAGAKELTRRSASSRWWKTGPTFCLAPGWGATPRGKLLWPKK